MDKPEKGLGGGGGEREGGRGKYMQVNVTLST